MAKGAPVSVQCTDHSRFFGLQVDFDCGTYKDMIVFQFGSEEERMKSHAMWNEIINTAERHYEE